MSDLTQGSIPRHLVRLAIPLAIGMVFQTLYYLIDLFFVARLGDAAVAGVSAAGNVQFVVMALTQVLGVGTMALIAQAVGRKDQADVDLVFNQSLVLAGLLTVFTLVGGYAAAGWYMDSLGADAESRALGYEYLLYFLPGLTLQFSLISMGSALRGTGIVKPTMMIQVLTVGLNALLAPILIAGWLTGRPFGVAGAGIATSVAVAVAVIAMWSYFRKLDSIVTVIPRLLKPMPAVWSRILKVGLPPGGEFLLMFVYMAAIYWIIRHFGASAQAGFGIGSRVMQAIFLPAMAVAFATAPLAGQNFGAGDHGRVREVFRSSALLGSGIMILLTLLCQWRPELLLSPFTEEPAVVAVGAEFLRYISWNFVASGIIFTCSGMFQAIGNTIPSLIASATRLATFVTPAVWMARRPGFELRHLWMLSMATVTVQALFTWWMLQRELRRRFATPVPALRKG